MLLGPGLPAMLVPAHVLHPDRHVGHLRHDRRVHGSVVGRIVAVGARSFVEPEPDVVHGQVQGLRDFAGRRRIVTALELAKHVGAV